MKKTIIHAIAITLLLTSCKKNELTNELPTIDNTKGVYILNEGNFMKSNSSLDLYSYDSNKVYSDVFYSSNNRSLGDVANDIFIFENKAFIVVNNSHKLEIISTLNNKSLGTIQLPNKSPRRVYILNSTTGYITNWNENSVTVFNPTTYEIIKDKITVDNFPEGIAFANGKLYVCNSGLGKSNTVSVINISTNTEIKKIKVGFQPYDISVDSDGDLIVCCRGFMDWTDPSKDIEGGIYSINSSLDSAVAKINLPLSTFGHPEKMVVSNYGFGIVKTINGILKFDTKINQIINQNFINNYSAYSIGIDDSKSKIFVGDPKNYITNGKVYIYNFSGNLNDSITVGLLPNSFAFLK